MFRTAGIWDKFDLNCILGKGEELFKLIGQFRYTGKEDLPQEFLIENSSINVEVLENNTGQGNISMIYKRKKR